MDKYYPRDMKLSAWARQYGVNYRTAWRWVRDGKLPEGTTAIRTSTGTILVNVPVDTDPKKAALFLLESEDDEVPVGSKELSRWLEPYGFVNLYIVTGTRSKLVRLIRTVKHQTIIVDGSVADPFTFDLLEAALWASGRKLLVYKDPRRTSVPPAR